MTAAPFDRELVTKWIEALESGKYGQTTGQLRRKYAVSQPRYCCLGVLCDVINPDGWDDSNWISESGEVDAHELVQSVARRVGLERDGAIPSGFGIGEKDRREWLSHLPTLTSINDSGVYGFREIAGMLREYYGIPREGGRR